MDSKVLGFFNRHPGATQSDLAQHSGATSAARAAREGPARPRPARGAGRRGRRRNVRLSLTADGHAVQRGLQKQALRVGASAVAGLTADQHRQLCTLLRHVLGNLDEPG